MNKIFFVALLFLISATINAQNAKVYFIRSDGFQAPAAGFSLFIDQKPVGHLNNKRYSVHSVTPGSHNFSSQFSGKKFKDKAEKMEQNIEAGKTYYVKVNFKHGIFSNKLKFKQVDEKDAKEMLPGLRESKN